MLLKSLTGPGNQWRQSCFFYETLYRMEVENTKIGEKEKIQVHFDS